METHFSVDGTLLEAWASMKSFHPKDDTDTPGSGQGRNPDWDKRMVVLPRASADQLCHLIVTEGIGTVICSGIEDDYYQYLVWKRIEVIDSVIRSSEAALERFAQGTLKPGKIL